MLLTIYTPTFNRCNLLPRVYRSLCAQTCKEFEWLIIDDGSTDCSRNLVNSWISENLISIKYVYKENGGVHTARDLAFELVDSELVWGVDSDDWLEESAVENVLNLWKTKGENDYCGIFAPIANFRNGCVDDSYPQIDAVSFQDLCYKHHFHGDQDIIIRSDIVKKLKKFPVYENEKLVSESYKWIQLPNLPFLICPKTLKFFEYRDDGYTQNVRKNYFRNLHGYRDMYSMHIDKCRFRRVRIKSAIKFCIAQFFLREVKFWKKTNNPYLVAACCPISVFLFLYLSIKWRRYR